MSTTNIRKGHCLQRLPESKAKVPKYPAGEKSKSPDDKGEGVVAIYPPLPSFTTLTYIPVKSN